VGTLDPGTERCTFVAAGVLHEGARPSQMEKLAGQGKCKNWKNSLRMMQGNKDMGPVRLFLTVGVFRGGGFRMPYLCR
jgi:hypothetical protein